MEAGPGGALVHVSEVDELKLRRIFGAVILIDFTLFLVQFAAAPAIPYFSPKTGWCRSSVCWRCSSC